MNQQRKQAKQLSPGDRFIVSLRMAFEVRGSNHVEGDVLLSMVPVTCSQDCPNGCECNSSMLVGHDGPFQLRIDGKRKLEYIGNLQQLLAELEKTRARIERIQNGENGEQPSHEAQFRN